MALPLPRCHAATLNARRSEKSFRFKHLPQMSEIIMMANTAFHLTTNSHSLEWSGVESLFFPLLLDTWLCRQNQNQNQNRTEPKGCPTTFLWSPASPGHIFLVSPKNVSSFYEWAESACHRRRNMGEKS